VFAAVDRKIVASAKAIFTPITKFPLLLNISMALLN
jgi:hypothetical protein